MTTTMTTTTDAELIAAVRLVAEDARSRGSDLVDALFADYPEAFEVDE